MTKNGFLALAGLGVAALLSFKFSGPATGAIPAYTDFFLCDQPHFVVGRFPGPEGRKETEMFFRILGKLEAPIPGYTYILTEKSAPEAGQKFNARVLNLILKAPEKPVAKDETSKMVSVDKTMKFGDSITDVTIRVYRSKALGKEIKTIVCTLEAE